MVGEWNRRKCGEEKGRRSRSKEGRRWWRNKERGEKNEGANEGKRRRRRKIRR